MDVSKILGKTRLEAQILATKEVDDFENEGGAISLPGYSEPEPIEIRDIITDEIKVKYPDIHPLYEKHNKLLTELQELRDKKGKDYGTKEDPFANVRGAEEFGVKPWIGAANSANDCMTRIKTYARTGTLENESVRDSMLDLANYALIALVLWEEENEKNSLLSVDS